MALALVGSPLPGGVDAGDRGLTDEPVPLLQIGALGGAVVDDVDLGRRGALVQQGGEHPNHHVGILVVERDEHGDPEVLVAGHASLEACQHQLGGNEQKEDVEGPHGPLIQDMVPADQHAPEQPPHQTECHEDDGRRPTDPHECPRQSGGIGRALRLVRRRHGSAHDERPAAARTAVPHHSEPQPALEQQLDREAGQEDEKADEHDEHSD